MRSSTTNILRAFIRRRQFVSLSVVALLLAGGSLWIVPGSLGAQESGPWHAAEEVRRELFAAQTALAGDDAVAASAHVESAASIYKDRLASEIEGRSQVNHERIGQGFDRALQAVTDGDGAGLAALRADIWTSMLSAAAEVATGAAADGDPQTAGAWLLLREYRPATRFTRASADGTLAVEQLANGEIEPADAAATIEADLHDTYQALLTIELVTAEDALAGQLSLRQAEAAGLARGYWRIIRPNYAEQRGAPAASAADAVFDELGETTSGDDPEAVGTVIEEARSLLRGFQAVPLAEEEQARRANQLTRFLSLVPMEYKRGVRDGRVTLDIEIQEAISFLGGARSALDDLWPQIAEHDPQQATDIEERFHKLDGWLAAASTHESVAAPEDVQAETDQLLVMLKGAFPAEWTAAAGGDAEFEEIARLLDSIEQAVADDQYGQAESLRLEAYAVFDFGPELRLLGFKPDLVARLDGLFWHGSGGDTGLATAIANKESPEKVAAVRATLDESLRDAQVTLGAGPPPDGAVIFNSAIIVFREGLEAVLIFAALLASMIGAYAGFRKPMVIGGLLAFVATALTWVVFHYVLSSMRVYGEKLEAVVSLVAIGVLLLVLNWFFHNTYWSRWIQKFQGKKRTIIGMAAGQSLSFMLLGFASVYREGFETTLFLQALVLDAGTVTVLEGVVLGLVATSLVGVLVFVLHTKLPYKRLLVVTGVLIAGVLVTMVGNTVHVLQAVGWMPLTPIHGLDVPYWMGLWLGVYPTWEGLVLQVVSGVFVVGSYFVAEHQKNRERRQRVASAGAQ